MRRVFWIVIAVVVFLVIVVTTVFVSDKDDHCRFSHGSAVVTSEGLAQPMKDALDHITSYYRTPERPNHRGVDIGKPNGEPIYAMADGVVLTSGFGKGFGNWIVLQHTIDGEEYTTVYGHMYDQGLHVKVGDSVRAGQHIADEGSAGESTGPHLHFEVWKGNRHTNGQEMDPLPWLQRAAGLEKEKKEGAKEKPSSTQSREQKSAPSRENGGELLPTEKLASEDHLQVDSIRVARAVAQRFPEVKTIHGWRPKDKFPDHPSGRAVDIMIPNYNSGEGKRLGDEIRDYLYGNREFFNIEYMIWRQEYIPSEGSPNLMEDQGDDTLNHFDHVHITTKGGGFPKPGQKYGEAPPGGSANPGAVGTDSDCIPGNVGDSDLRVSEVPKEFVKWVQLGGQVCADIPASLLAAQIEQESQWQTHALSVSGALGPSQFMPGTWAMWGYKVDDNGKKISQAGEGDVHSPADATMAQARLMCSLADMAKEKVKAGVWRGDVTELALAAYNAGPGNVDDYGGVPVFLETQNYVKIIPQKAAKYRI